MLAFIALVESKSFIEFNIFSSALRTVFVAWALPLLVQQISHFFHQLEIATVANDPRNRLLSRPVPL